MIVDRYALHGLTGNPFAVPAAGVVDACFVDRDLATPPPGGSCTMVQVIGAKGAGKSTQLAAWQANAAGPYHYVPPAPYRSRWSRPPVQALVYADEIDRMPAPLRRWWFRRLANHGSTLVAGTHRDLARVARRSGLDVVTHQLGPADLATVGAVLHRKVEQARLDGTTGLFRLTAVEISTIHRRSRGSLRTAEALAHELVAQRVLSADTPVPSKLSKAVLP